MIQVQKDSADPENERTHTKINDGYVYAGVRTHVSMYDCEYIVTDRLKALAVTKLVIQIVLTFLGNRFMVINYVTDVYIILSLLLKLIL